MKNYRDLLSHKGVVRVMSSQLLARFAFGMMSIGFVMHIQDTQGSYAIAGIALGAETVGAALSGPVLGRKIGVWGIRRVIGWTTVITSLSILAIALLKLPAIVVIVLALIVGLTSPPIQSATRTIYPTITPERHRQLMFSLDATIQELIWIVGPVLATVVAATFYPAATLILMAIIQVAGSVWFLSNREITGLKIPASSSRLGGVLKNRTVFSLVIIGTLLVGSFSGVEVGTVAILDLSSAGWVIASLSVGSMIGGFVMGPRARSKYALSKFMVLVVGGYLLAFVSPDNVWWLALCWFIAGLGIAPILGLLSVSVSRVLKMGDTAEAYGWITTGQLMGYSAGAAVAGIAIDTVSPESALLVSAICGVATLVAALTSVSVMPKAESEKAK